MRRFAAWMTTSATIVSAAVALTVASADAYNKTVNYYYSGGRYLQANVWLGTGNPFGYATSTKYLGSGSGPSNASSITNTAWISVTGIGVSLGNASGGTSSDKDFSTTWTNYNTWISDRAGTNSTSNLFYLYVTGSANGSANIPYFGSPRTVSATVQKWT